MGGPRRVSLGELGRLREMLDRGHVKDGDLLIHPDGRTLRVYGTADGCGLETVGWPDEARRWALAPGQEPSGDPVVDVADAHERRIGELERRVEVLADRLNAGKPGFDFPWPPVSREAKWDFYRPVEMTDSSEPLKVPPVFAVLDDISRENDDRLEENAVSWPISKRRWLNERADSREGDSYVFDHVDNTTGRPMYRELDSNEQPVTEETAKRAQRLNDILLNIALAAERHHAIGLSTSDTQILNDYLDGLDPHCAVDSRDED